MDTEGERSRRSSVKRDELRTTLTVPDVSHIGGVCRSSGADERRILDGLFGRPSSSFFFVTSRLLSVNTNIINLGVSVSIDFVWDG